MSESGYRLVGVDVRDVAGQWVKLGWHITVNTVEWDPTPYLFLDARKAEPLAGAVAMVGSMHVAEAQIIQPEGTVWSLTTDLRDVKRWVEEVKQLRYHPEERFGQVGLRVHWKHSSKLGKLILCL